MTRAVLETVNTTASLDNCIGKMDLKNLHFMTSHLPYQARVAPLEKFQRISVTVRPEFLFELKKHLK